MDKLLDKFSLQTFLRQFFCGVVFFVPIWLFGRESLGELSNRRDKCSEGVEYQFYDIKGNRTDGDKVADLVKGVRSKLKESAGEASMIATPSYYFSYAFVNPRRRTLCLDQMFARFQVPFTNQVPSLSDLIGGLYKEEYLSNLSLKTVQKLSRAPFILKHEAYSYEKEIRALFYCDKSLQNPKDPDSYIVDLPNPPDFYEEFLFDSRLSDCEYEFYSRGLNEFYGIELSKIKKSTVFDQPEIIRVKARV